MSSRNQRTCEGALVRLGTKHAAKRVAHRGDLVLGEILPERQADRPARVDGRYRQKLGRALAIRRMRVTARSPPAQGCDLVLRQCCGHVWPIVGPEYGERGRDPVLAEAGR